MTGTETLIAVLSLLGVGALLRELAVGLIGWLTGRQERERSALRQAYADLDAARGQADAEAARADCEAARRRIVTEHAHQLRLLLIGLGADDIPPFPATPPKEI